MKPDLWSPFSVVALVLALVAMPGMVMSSSHDSPATPFGTPDAIAELVDSCPLTEATVMPGAANLFTEYGLGGPDVWLAGWGSPPKGGDDEGSTSGSAYIGEFSTGPMPDGWLM